MGQTLEENHQNTHVQATIARACLVRASALLFELQAVGTCPMHKVYDQIMLI